MNATYIVETMNVDSGRTKTSATLAIQIEEVISGKLDNIVPETPDCGKGLASAASPLKSFDVSPA